MLIASKEEMFKRAYTGLQNICRQKKIGSIHNINSTEFSYPNGNKTSPAILFVISPSKYYIFAFDDGLIIEYIDNKINVLDFNHINKEYDVNSNQEIIDTIYNIGRNVINHSTAYFAQTFFKKKLNKTHSKYLSDNDKNIINEFLNHSKLSTDKADILYKHVSEILFLKSGHLLINSSQLELDMRELDEYYFITFRSIDESKTFRNREYNKATDNIYKIVNKSMTKFFNGLDCEFTINDKVEANITLNIAKVKSRCPFFIPSLGKYLTRSAEYTRAFCVEERRNLNWIHSVLDYSRYIINLNNYYINDLKSFTNYMFLSPTAIDQLNSSQLNIDARCIYIVFGRASANKLVEKINENESAKLLETLDEYNTNIPTEDEFLDNMRTLYKELKKSSEIQSYLYRKFEFDFKSRFKNHFEQDRDIEVI